MTNYIPKRITFKSDHLELVGYLFSPSEIKNPPGILFLHGASKKMDTNIFESWQKYLCEKGYASFSFYTRGVAESEGEYTESSLLNREKDSLCALNVFIDSGSVDKNNITVIANSMGGHVGAKISADPLIKATILYAAAAYGKEAEDKNLDPTFTEAISKPNSWQNSPAFDALQKANKPLLVIYPELDTVIPQEVKAGYKALVQSENYIEVPKTTHQSISEKTDEDKKLMQNTFEISANFLATI